LNTPDFDPIFPQRCPPFRSGPRIPFLPLLKIYSFNGDRLMPLSSEWLVFANLLTPTALDSFAIRLPRVSEPPGSRALTYVDKPGSSLPFFPLVLSPPFFTPLQPPVFFPFRSMSSCHFYTSESCFCVDVSCSSFLPRAAAFHFGGLSCLPPYYFSRMFFFFFF